jgi:hypothetical protein
MAGDAENPGGQRTRGWRMAFWGAAAAVLLAPLAAMQVADEPDWTAFDFAVMGALLGGVGLGFELAVRRRGDAGYRAGVGIALAAAFLLVWINGAVGVIGSEDEDANLLYGGVLAVAFVGAALARFRPAGMARAMAAAAAAQALIPLIAASVWAGARPLVWSPQVLGLTVLFAAMWLLSAWQFRRAGVLRSGA